MRQNMNCTFVDCNKITIGNHVLIASNVQLYTSTHPVELSERLAPDWKVETGQYFCRTYALPIKIGDKCWLDVYKRQVVDNAAEARTIRKLLPYK